MLSIRLPPITSGRQPECNSELSPLTESGELPQSHITESMGVLLWPVPVAPVAGRLGTRPEFPLFRIYS